MFEDIPVEVPSAKNSTVRLLSGRPIPLLGLGTWQSKGKVVEDAIKIAINAGYRHIDTASRYENEEDIGRAVREMIKDGTISRDDMFITTKLWNDSHSPDDVIEACKTSRDKLGLDYIDLYLMHWPFGYKKDNPSEEDPTTIEQTWKAMEKCIKLGFTHNIGVANFNSAQIKQLLKTAKVWPVVNQVECHIYLNQKELIAFCKLKHIVVVAYAPFGSPERPGHCPDNAQFVLVEHRLYEIAEQHKKTIAQVALKYLIQRGVVPIPKSSNEERIKENANIFDFQLTAKEMTKIDKFNLNERAFPFNEAKNHRDYPFNIFF